MQYLIRKATVVDSRSPHNGQCLDILIENGTITRIAPQIEISENVHILSPKNCSISPAFCELQADFGDPGFEYKASLENGLQAAAKAGFSAVGIMPNTQPVIDNKAQINYLHLQSASQVADIVAIGASTTQLNGFQLAEMNDMRMAGARAFSNGLKGLQDDATMLRILQYLSAFDGLLFNFPVNESLSLNGQLNEGLTSTKMGLKGQANMAELLMVQRDIELIRYTGARLHFTQISTKEAVSAIRQAKKEGLKITAAVSPWHLIFTEEKLLDFDTNWKMNPPLRTQSDRLALLEGLQDGTIDCISCFHLPHHIDDKLLEFDKAEFGVLGLETVFALLNTHLDFSLEEIITFISTKPRQILGLPSIEITEGAAANLAFFQVEETFILEKKTLISISKNTPLLGETLTGKTVGIFHNGRVSF